MAERGAQQILLSQTTVKPDRNVKNNFETPEQCPKTCEETEMCLFK